MIRLTIMTEHGDFVDFSSVKEFYVFGSTFKMTPFTDADMGEGTIFEVVGEDEESAEEGNRSNTNRKR